MLIKSLIILSCVLILSSCSSVTVRDSGNGENGICLVTVDGGYEGNFNYLSKNCSVSIENGIIVKESN